MAVFTKRNKEIFIFFLICFSIANFNIWGILLYYLHSYFKYFDETITVKDVFGLTYLMYIGLLISSWVLPSILSIFGFKNAIRIGSLIYALNCIMSYSTLYWPLIMLNTTLLGFCFRYMQTLTILYFKTNYPEDPAKCYGISTTGMVIGGIVWGNLMTFYINPDNLNPNKIFTKGNYEELYFSFDIANRFKGIMNIQAIFNIVLVFTLSFCFKEPEGYQSNLNEFWKLLINKENRLSNKIQKTSSSLDKSISFCDKSFSDDEKDQELIEKRIEDKEKANEKTVKQRAIEELKSTRFILIVFISIFRKSFPSYLIDNIKIFGSLIVHNDQLVTNLYAFAGFIATITMTFASSIVNRFGLFYCFVCMIIINMIIEVFGITIMKSSPLLFMICIPLSRIVGNINNIIGFMTIFSNYDADLALQMNKIFDSHVLIANILVVILNNLFYSPGSFYLVFLVYLLLDGIALLLTLFKLKPLVKDNKIWLIK